MIGLSDFYSHYKPENAVDILKLISQHLGMNLLAGSPEQKKKKERGFDSPTDIRKTFPSV